MGLGHQVGSDAADLGQPVHLDEVRRRPRLHRGPQQRQRHRGRAVRVGLELAEHRDRLLAALQHLREHGRHQEGAVGAGHDRAGQRGAVGVAGHQAGDAVVDAEEHVRRPADVEERHRDEVDVAVLEHPAVVGVHGVGEHVGLREHHALGVAGRAGGVHDEHDVVGRHRGVAVDGGRGGEQRFVLVAGRAVRRHLDDPLHAGQTVAQLLDQRHQLAADEQHPGARVVDGVVDLVAGQPEVDDRVGRADQGAGEGQLHAGRVVLVEERHHVAAPDPHVLQGSGEPAHPVVPLRPGPRPVQVRHRGLVGLHLRPVRQSVGQEDGIGERHGVHSPARTTSA